jgi:MFS family permease
VGIILGFSTGLIFKPIPDGREWRYMFILGAILPVVMIVLVLTVMPESPRWLVQKNREEEAKAILQKIYPDGYNVDLVISDIKEALEREEAAEIGVGWEIIMFPTPAFRRMLLVGVGTAVAQQAVGIDAIQYYLPDVLEDSGIESDKKQSIFLIFLGILKLIFIVVGGKLFDKKGRKPLLLVSLGGMACALLMLSVAFFINLSSGFTVFGLALYLSFFSIGMGPGAWLIPSEIFATCIRAKAMSVATTLNRAAATIMSSTVVSLSNALGWGGFFLMLCMICLVVAGFLIIYLPETKGRSLEQMSIYFADITKDSSILDAEAKILKRRQNTDENNSPNLQQTAPLRGEIEML